MSTKEEFHSNVQEVSERNTVRNSDAKNSVQRVQTDTEQNNNQIKEKEITDNVRGKETPDTSNAESTGGENVSREEGGRPESIRGKIKEILRRTSANRNNDGIGKSGTENSRNETKVGAGELNSTKTKYKHLYDEEKVSKEYLNSVNNDIENAIINIRDGKLENVPEVIEVTQLNENTVKSISNFVGYDISGYTCKIERDRLVHIEDRHGIKGEHDQSLSDPKDTARMGYVLNNSDNIEWVVDDKGN